MIAGWDRGTRLLVRTTAGGLASCKIDHYDRDGFYVVDVLDGPQRGRRLVVHEDDATRDEDPDQCEACLGPTGIRGAMGRV